MASILTNQSITDKIVLCVLLYNYQFTVYIVTSVVCVWAGHRYILEKRCFNFLNRQWCNRIDFNNISLDTHTY